MTNLLLWAFTVVGALLLAGGVIALLAAARGVASAAGSKGWPTVPGKVVSSDVRMVTRKVQFGDEPARNVLEHKVEVRYEYRVKNVVFSGIDLGEGATQSNSEEWAQARAARFPVGREMPVYYSPKDPTRSVLEPGVKPMGLVPVGVGLALCVTGIAMIVISRTWATGA